MTAAATMDSAAKGTAGRRGKDNIAKRREDETAMVFWACKNRKSAAAEQAAAPKSALIVHARALLRRLFMGCRKPASPPGPQYVA
ncbi:hypothetical protein [Comamonas testosteroni]|uniref:hypothetical protein n=1 Tax=Comamonas testosteroni TaxID=285 RepID=UPI001E3ADAEB|nr:hypothetical protein [Comamonas testosteroni]